MKADRYRKQWRELLKVISDEQFLAAKNYGITMDPKKHRDLLDRDAGASNALARVLKEVRKINRRNR